MAVEEVKFKKCRECKQIKAQDKYVRKLKMNKLRRSRGRGEEKVKEARQESTTRKLKMTTWKEKVEKSLVPLGAAQSEVKLQIHSA